jgi:pimeloyl-ACP methyl ester carboxylesterase
MREIEHLDVAGRAIAYRLREGKVPALLFLPGYASDMEGAKALALDAFAERHGLGMVRFDYSGTGSSPGKFEDGTLALWLEEALAVFDRIIVGEGKVIVVGSSMGGWIALHLALLRPKRTHAVVGIAAAPDFTDWGFTAEQKQELIHRGRIEEPNPYGPEPSVVTRTFWESGQQLRLLNREIAIDCPVRLIHGEQDEEVPVHVAFNLMRRLRSSDVQLNVLKGGGHRLSEPQEIRAILGAVEALLEPKP